MYKRDIKTFTGKGEDTNKLTAALKATHNADSKKNGFMIGYMLISIDTDLTDKGNGWSATCTMVYKSNRVPKHQREKNRLEREIKKVSKADYYRQHLDLIEPEHTE